MSPNSLVEDETLQLIKGFSRPVSLTEISDGMKKSLDETEKIVSNLVEAEKVYTKVAAGDDFKLVWPNKSAVCPANLIVSRSTPRKPFRVPSAASPRDAETSEEICKDIEAAKERARSLDNQLLEYSQTDEERLQGRIEMLHEYNEVKDSGVALLGKLAEVEKSTVTDLYESFGLRMED